MTDYQIIPLTREKAEEIITWNYQPPYGVYDLSPEDLNGLLNPEYRYHQVLDLEGELVGYCCYGVDAQVPGGDYYLTEPEVMDIGVGMIPALTGQGRGAGFVRAIMDFGEAAYRPKVFRATVAGFNQRSMRTFQGLGFEIKGDFVRELVDIHFFQLEKQIMEE